MNYVLAHEHVTIDLSGVKQNDDCRLDNPEEIIAEYRPLREQGFGVVIDQTSRGMGRNPLLAERLMAEAGLTLRHATGFYKEPFLPPECYQLDEGGLAALMVRELTVGIDDTGIKASHIGEIGSSLEAITPVEQAVFRAAGRAHRETGTTICTHTTLGRQGMEQVELFRELGVDLSKVVISHTALAGESDYLLRLADTGVNLAFDTIGKLNYQSDENRADWIGLLLDRGYGEQVVLSLDITRRSQYRRNGGIGFCYLMDSFVPLLRRRGVTEAQLEQLLSKNPARIYQIY